MEAYIMDSTSEILTSFLALNENYIEMLSALESF